MESQNKSALLFILAHTKKYAFLLIAGVVFILIQAAVQTVSPIILGAAIDYIDSNGNAAMVNLSAPVKHILLTPVDSHVVLLRFALLLVIVAAAAGLSRAIARILMGRTSRFVAFDMRNDYLRHLQKMSMRFFQEHKTGDLMARATNDLNAITKATGFGMIQPISAIITIALSVNYMLRINATLTALALMPLPLTILLMYTALKKIHFIQDRIQTQFATLTAKTQENLAGIRVIKSYVRSGWEIDNFRIENERYIKTNLSNAKLKAFLETFLDVLYGASALIVILVGGLLIIRGKLTIGELVAFYSYIFILFWPMMSLGWVVDLWQRAITGAMRLQKIMTLQPDIRDSDKTDFSITRLESTIEFNNVSFSYPGTHRPAVKNISFTLKKGKTMAIVGSTGSGKSTLIHLLPRLIEPTEGEILIGGHDIRTIPLSVLRNHIGIVQQESFLFSDTIAGNIRFGATEAQEHAIAHAAAVSQLELDIDQFPDGLETEIGERGITLSGGQKQRTSISRAIIRKPSILILDDALSAVDTYTEEEILSKIHPLMASCTTIIVAHRISTIRNADLILVLENGEIVERGTHEELLQRKSYYYEMNRRQQLESNLQDMS